MNEHGHEEENREEGGGEKEVRHEESSETQTGAVHAVQGADRGKASTGSGGDDVPPKAEPVLAPLPGQEVGAVPQTELVKELGLPQRKMADIRRKHMLRQDWFYQKRSRGKPRVMITIEGQRKLRIFAECQDTTPQVIQTFGEFPIVKLLPNPQWVVIGVPNGMGETESRNCVVPLRLGPFLRRGQRIKVEIVTDRDGTSYRHESLAGF